MLASPSPSGPTDSPEVICAECRRRPRDDENADDDWRAYSDGVGELIVFCRECADRDFGDS